MPTLRPAVIPERFPLDSSEARFHEKVEQRIERNLASGQPALTREEVDQKARAVIESARIRHASGENHHSEPKLRVRSQSGQNQQGW